MTRCLKVDSRAVELVIEEVLSLSKHSLFSLAFSLSLTREGLSVSEMHRNTTSLALCLSPCPPLFSLTHTVLCRDSEQMGGWTVLSNKPSEGRILCTLCCLTQMTLLRYICFTAGVSLPNMMSASEIVCHLVLRLQ